MFLGSWFGVRVAFRGRVVLVVVGIRVSGLLGLSGHCVFSRGWPYKRSLVFATRVLVQLFLFILEGCG